MRYRVNFCTNQPLSFKDVKFVPVRGKGFTLLNNKHPVNSCSFYVFNSARFGLLEKLPCAYIDSALLSQQVLFPGSQAREAGETSIVAACSKFRCHHSISILSL